MPHAVHDWCLTSTERRFSITQVSALLAKSRLSSCYGEKHQSTRTLLPRLEPSRANAVFRPLSRGLREDRIGRLRSRCSMSLGRTGTSRHACALARGMPRDAQTLNLFLSRLSIAVGMCMGIVTGSDAGTGHVHIVASITLTTNPSLMGADCQMDGLAILAGSDYAAPSFMGSGPMRATLSSRRRQFTEL